MGSEPPEFVVISDDDDFEADRPGVGPSGARRWAVLIIGALLVFGIGVGVGAHLDGDRSAGGPTPGTSPSAPSHTSTTRSASPTAPGTSSAASSSAASGMLSFIENIEGPEPLPGSTGWQLFGYRGLSHVGYDDGSLIRYDPAGTVWTTPVLPLYSSTLGSFVVTVLGAIVLPGESNGDGYVIPDDAPVVPAPDTLSSPVFPMNDGRHLWTASSAADSTDATRLIPATLDGNLSIGPVLTLPQAASSPASPDLSPDGSGYVLATGTGGVYDLRPEGNTLVTHGLLLAVGPTAYLAWECDGTGSCAANVIDKASGTRRALAGFALPDGPVFRGVISPDGRQAALMGWFGAQGLAVRLVDLTTGAANTIDTTPPRDNIPSDSSALMAFTPEGRYLLVATTSGVLPVDTTTGATLDALPLPPVDAIAIRPNR